MRRRSAYYSRNDSFSRSANAEAAEEEGRYPRTRAAAALGLSVKAFDAGCRAAGYRATEWHHVGKYASMVDYYDTEELADNPEFWRGAAEAYKSKAKRAAVLATMERRREEDRQAAIEAFRRRLINQRDCTRPVRRHDGRVNWIRRCGVAGVLGKEIPPVGDEDGFQAAAARAAEKQADQERRKAGLMSLLKTYFTLGRDDYDREVWKCGDVTVFIHDGGVNVGPRYRPNGSKPPKGYFGLGLSFEVAAETVRRILGL
jgi:hypothetical protein